MSRWSSHRFRRRALWGAAAAVAATAIVVPTVLLGNTAKPEPERFSKEPTWVYREPKHAKLTSLDRRVALDTSIHFVRTAVARKRLDEAYALAAPELRQGLTKRQWMTGNIPVVPFPAVAVAQWDVAYSYENDVAFQLSLVAKPGASPVVGKTFTIELVRRRRGAPWRVVSWAPLGISGANNDVEIAARQDEVAAEAVKRGAPLATWWLVLPVGVLALVVLIPIGLGVRSWLAGRRAEREYRADRGLS